MVDESKPSYPDRIGAHALQVEGDLIRMTFQGEFLPEDAQQLTEIVDLVGREAGNRVFFVANLHKAGPPGPEARRVFGSWRPQCHFFTVYYGAALWQQAFAALIESAMQTLGGKATRGRFVETEAEALAAIEEERHRLGA
jgi:hypothetical protein